MTQRSYVWQEWLAASVLRKASVQSSELGTQVDCWFEDGGEKHSCTMWRGVVPYAIEATYSQAQNDADLDAYDEMLAADSFNNAIEQRNREGRLVTQPVTLDANQWHYWHSIGDTAGALRAGGQFKLSKSVDGDTDTSWQYRDPVWMAGGELMFQGATIGDHVSFCVYAPATPVTASSGGNTGNCNVYYGVIVPAAGNGAYNVDLDEAHPVPAPAEDGYWDYALPANMQFGGTTTVSTSPPNEYGQGTAKFHLISQRFDLTRFVAKELLLGSGKAKYEPQNINASLCLPEWRFECVLHNEGGGHTIDVVWRVLVSRYWTTV